MTLLCKPETYNPGSILVGVADTDTDTEIKFDHVNHVGLAQPPSGGVS